MIVLTNQSILTILMFLYRLSLSLCNLSIFFRCLLVFTLFIRMLYIIIVKIHRRNVVDVPTILIHSVSFKRIVFVFLIETIILMSLLLILFTSISLETVFLILFTSFFIFLLHILHLSVLSDILIVIFFFSFLETLLVCIRWWVTMNLKESCISLSIVFRFVVVTYDPFEGRTFRQVFVWDRFYFFIFVSLSSMF